MWEVYPEAMACNIAGVHSDLKVGERIWSSVAQRANFKVHYEISPSGATSQELKPESVPPTFQAIAFG